MLFRSANRQTISRVLSVIFTLMLFNGIVFRHAHRLPNGRIITHAHPFWPDGKGPLQTNTHTSNELLLLDAVANGSFVPDSPQLIDFRIIVWPAFTPVFVRSASSPVQPFFCFSHRGPPARFVVS